MIDDKDIQRYQRDGFIVAPDVLTTQSLPCE